MDTDPHSLDPSVEAFCAAQDRLRSVRIGAYRNADGMVALQVITPSGWSGVLVGADISLECLTEAASAFNAVVAGGDVPAIPLLREILDATDARRRSNGDIAAALDGHAAEMVGGGL